MREICRFLKLYELAKPSQTALNNFYYSDASRKGNFILEGCVLPLLVALQLTDLKELQSFMAGRNPKPFVDLLMDEKYPYIQALNIHEMPIYKQKGDACISDVITSLYEKIYNPSFLCDLSLYGNNLNIIEFQPQIVKVFHESFSLISKFNRNEDKK